MNYNFFVNLYKNLIKNEFLLINGFFDKNEIDFNSKFVGLYKAVGNFLYCVILINNSNETDYCNHIKEIQDKTEKLAKLNQIENVIFLNIIATEKVDSEMLNFVNTFNFDLETSINNLCWIADYNNKKIITSKNQPTEILDIHKIIKQSFFEENETSININENSFSQIAEEIEKEEYAELKSNNYLITIFLIIINVFVFTLEELNGGSENSAVLIKFGAVVSDFVLTKHEFYRLLTGMFLHIGITHIASNCLSLYILGTRSEKYFGKAFFLTTYILSGIGASLASVFFTKGLSAGASGAIFGIMGAMLVYSHKTKKSIGDFSGYFMVIFSLISIGAGFMEDGIDNAGHLGGFITGAIIAYIYTSLKRKTKVHKNNL